MIQLREAARRGAHRSARRPPRVAGAVCCAAMLLLAGCGEEEVVDGTGMDPPVDEGTTPEDEPTATEVTGDELTFSLLAEQHRAIPPDGEADDATTLAVVGGDVDVRWSTWGPTRASAPPPPELPDGATPVFLWDHGKDLTIDRVVDGPVGLVVEATRARPPAGCGASAEVGGTTFLLAVDGDHAEGAAEVVVDEVEGAC